MLAMRSDVQERFVRDIEEAYLLADGSCIHEVKNLAMRIQILASLPQRSPLQQAEFRDSLRLLRQIVLHLRLRRQGVI